MQQVESVHQEGKTWSQLFQVQFADDKRHETQPWLLEHPYTNGRLTWKSRLGRALMMT